MYLLFSVAFLGVPGAALDDVFQEPLFQLVEHPNSFAIKLHHTHNIIDYMLPRSLYSVLFQLHAFHVIPAIFVDHRYRITNVAK